MLSRASALDSHRLQLSSAGSATYASRFVHYISSPKTRLANRSSARKAREILALASVNPSSTKKRNIVVAVEDTEASWHTVKWALENIYRDGDTLHLLHVIPKEKVVQPVPATLLASTMDSLDYGELLETHARDFTLTLLQLAYQYKATCEIDLVKGKGREHIGATICKKSEELNAAMVVVTADSGNIFHELFVGSVSNYVASNCKQHTLIFQPKPELQATDTGSPIASAAS